MVQVLIVGKTKKWDKACVGGIIIDKLLKEFAY